MGVKILKKQRMVLKLKWTSILFLLALSATAQVSPFNQEKINGDTNSYSFIVSGHFHGSSKNTSGLPANTLLANLDLLNETSNMMIVSLGDLFLDVSKDPKFYEKYFFSNLKTPLFNAVGNHDLTDNIYQDKYGSTYFYFFVGNDLHFFLDTEENDSDIDGEQLNQLKKALKEAQLKKSPNIFIYGHRTIWSRNHPKMKDLFRDNTQSVTGNNNFRDDVLPLLEEVGKTSDIYLFAGSLGPAPASFFYYKEENQNIHYICSAIRALNRDAVLRIHRDEKGALEMETISLTGENVEALEYYDLKTYLEFDPVKPFNWRLVPLYIKNMILHRYFWYGLLYSLLGVFAIFLWRRKFRKSH